MKLVVIQRWGKKLVTKKSGYRLNGLMPESTFSPPAKLLCCDYMEKIVEENVVNVSFSVSFPQRTSFYVLKTAHHKNDYFLLNIEIKKATGLPDLTNKNTTECPAEFKFRISSE